MKHFYNDALTIYNEASRDAYGRQVWGSGVAVTGRFVEHNKLLYSATGEAQMSDALIHVLPETSLQIGTRVTFDSIDYRVIKLSKPKDGTGTVRFIKAYLQLWT